MELIDGSRGFERLTAAVFSSQWSFLEFLLRCEDSAADPLEGWVPMTQCWLNYLENGRLAMKRCSVESSKTGWLRGVVPKLVLQDLGEKWCDLTGRLNRVA